jgi:methionyl-tRNA formyltransferase
MRLVMVGTGPFGVPTLGALYESRHLVVALVAGAGKECGPAGPPPTLLRAIAEGHRTPIYDLIDVNSEDSRRRLVACHADLLVVCDYGQILSSPLLAAARLGGVNLHASLLPAYRGAAPINWAIYHGERETGVSVIHMTPQVDAGPVIAQERTAIGPQENAVELEQRLADLGARLVCRAIDLLESGDDRALPQDPALASRAPRLKKSHGLVDWSRPAEAIANQVRAMEPWPKTYTFWHRPQGSPLRLIFGPVEVVEGPPEGPPGTVLEAHHSRLVIAAGRGAVAPLTLQPAGKRVLSIGEFLRGYKVSSGDRFDPPPTDVGPQP